jgi:hypothetical protein
MTEEDVEDYCTRDSTSTLLVSSRTHAQLGEEDPANEGTNIEGGSDQEGKRQTLQHYTIYVPDKVRVECEGEGQHPCTHGLQR